MNRYIILSVALVIAVTVASVLLLPRMPDAIPTHWNIRGQVDGYSPKLLGAFLMPGMMAALLAFIYLLKWLSPEGFEAERSGETFDYVVFCVTALLAAIHALVLRAAIAHVDVNRALMSLMFIFFLLIGNVIGRVKRNFWMGIRTPWTLASDDVWDKTHRFGGRCWVITGTIGLLLTIAGASFTVLIVFFLIGAMLPVPYSLLISKAGASTS